MSFSARWRGEAFAASPELRVDGWWLWLSASSARAGFTALTEGGPWVREVPVAECEVVFHRRTTATWRGVPCLLVDERGAEGLLHLAGEDPRAALAAGFEPAGPGVLRRWVPLAELADRTVELLPLGAG